LGSQKASSGQMKNVRLATSNLQNLLDAMAINIKHLNIVALDGGGDNLIVSFETKKGTYSLNAVWKGTLEEHFILKHPFMKNKNIFVSRFSNDAIQQIVAILLKYNDTNPIEPLFNGLCAFWDHIISQVYTDLSFSLIDAVRKIYKLVYKNPLAMIDPYPYYKHPELFIYFVSSPIGNTLYYFSGLHKRKDIQRAITGDIF
jgi:hypothetical protein